LAKSQPHDRQARLDEADADLILAWVLGGNGSSPSTRELTEAIALDHEAVEILTELTPVDATIRRRIAFAKYYLAFHYWKSHAFHESLRIIDGMLSAETTRSVGSTLMVSLYNWRGNTFARLAGCGKV